MPRIGPLADRQARYERIMAMRGADPVKPAMSLDQIAEALGDDPLTGKPLTRQRVQQIISSPPKAPGRPPSPSRRDVLRRKLSTWERRRGNKRERGAETTFEDERIRVLSADLARLGVTEHG